MDTNKIDISLFKQFKLAFQLEPTITKCNLSFFGTHTLFSEGAQNACFPPGLGKYLDNQEKTVVLYERPQPLTPCPLKWCYTLHCKSTQFTLYTLRT